MIRININQVKFNLFVDKVKIEDYLKKKKI